MEGEASANNRKAKLIFFFEWNLQLKWIVSFLDAYKYYELKICNV